MSSNPYENEPGYENAKSQDDQENMTNYKAKVTLSQFLETPRVDQLNSRFAMKLFE